MVSCLAGDLTISYAPSTLRFGQASALRASSLDDVLAAAMGYTPETSSWSGLTVTSPFKSPSAVVVVGLDGSGSELLQEGVRYTLQEDQPLLKVFASLHSTVSARAQRPIHFQHMEVADSVDEDEVPASLESSSLETNRQPDAAFLLEVSAMPNLLTKVEANSSAPHGGQDFYFFQLESFAHLVKAYGDDSPQVREGKQLVRDGVSKLVTAARAQYGDQVLVVSAVLDKPVSTRRERSLLQSEAVKDVNLAVEYSEDYPAIFNIILFLSIVLLLAVIATSASMAYMDPGRDSIIYRMTNPRMKKDQ